MPPIHCSRLTGIALVVVTLGPAGMLAGTASPYTPVTATFLSGTAVTSDQNEAYAASQTHIVQVGRNTFSVDGAFFNEQGGIDINLIPESNPGPAYPERAMLFTFPPGSQSGLAPKLASGCNLQTGPSALTSYDVDFRFNLKNGSVADMPSGTTETAPNIAGIIDFALPVSKSASWRLMFGMVTEPSQLSITRESDDRWTLTSSAVVLLRCASGKVRDIDTYLMPFTLEVVK